MTNTVWGKQMAAKLSICVWCYNVLRILRVAGYTRR